MTRVLLVEDERAIAESLEFALRRDGFEVTHAPTLQAARRALSPGPGAAALTIDLVVLDLMLPDGSGFDLLGYIRGSGQRLPVIILSSRDEEADRVAGLEGGADDYVIKPFSPREVVARIRAVLRRAQPLPPPPSSESGPHAAVPPAPDERGAASSPMPQSGPDLALNSATRRTSYRGAPVDLTRTEFDLLAVLCSAPDRVFTRAQLIDRIFGEDHAVYDRTIDAHVKALRKKLTAAGADPDLIETERGVGYRLRSGDAER